MFERENEIEKNQNPLKTVVTKYYRKSINIKN